MFSRQKKTAIDTSITEGKMIPAIMTFFLPILVGSFFQQLYNTVDALVVGRFLGKEALAAVGGGTSTFVNLLLGLFLGISNGASVVVSQYYGAQNKEKTISSVHTSMVMSLVGGIIVTIAGIAVSEPAMRLIGTPEDILDLSVSYLNVYFLGMVPLFLYNMGSSVLRSLGDSKRPLYILIVTCVANIILDIVFVLYLGMGVEGAAWATVICMTLSTVLVYWAIFKVIPGYSFRPSELKPAGDILKRMLSLGIPAGVQGSMYNISNLIIQASVNSLGTVMIAAYAAYGKIDAMFWLCLNSFGVALTVFAGQNYGAGHITRVKDSVKLGMVVGCLMAAGFSTVYMIYGPQLYSLFATEAEVIDAGMIILRTIVPFYFTYVTIEVLSGIIRGCGQSLIPSLITLFGVCVVRIIWIYTVFPMSHDITTLVIIYPITWVLTSIAFWVYYLRGKWLKTAKPTGAK